MSPDVNPDVHSDISSNMSPTRAAAPQRPLGIRTHVLLVFAMALVTVFVTGLCLLVIRLRLQAEVTDNLAHDLTHSVAAFEDRQAERMAALERENNLLANLPTLKALMTSGDDLTIQDGAVEFWQISGADLFALADSNGRIVAAYARGEQVDDGLRAGLKTLLDSPGRRYLVEGNAFYACSVRPLYFGNEQNGTLLGYVVSGLSIERTVRQISEPAGVEAAFLNKGRAVASTLPTAMQSQLAARPELLSSAPGSPSAVQLGATHFLAATEDLSSSSTAPLRLVVLKSFEPAEQSIHHLDRLILSVGLLALLCGTALMVTLATLLTRPLEELSKSVRAFGTGDVAHKVPRGGTQEVRQLSAAFTAMRDEIQQANRALVESERLATIGRMANSVSHDFRHFLAAIYANAEFLASGRLAEKERIEIFADIRTAVLGTTDMIESLLVFSRTGARAQRVEGLVASLVEHAVALAQTHPDAEGIAIDVRIGDVSASCAMVDGKQLERAIFNLILNACQSIRAEGQMPRILISLETRPDELVLQVVDNGAGVPQKIRGSLFEPFVSEGKQKGTGLGLTLAHRVAVEHGGEVKLISSRPGETIFQMRLARGQVDAQPGSEIQDRVLCHENERNEHASAYTRET